MKAKNSYLWALTVISSVGFSCGTSDESSTTGPDKLAMVVTTDFQSGAISVVKRNLSVTKDVITIHSDAVCRYDQITKHPYVVSRLGADAIEVLDPESFSVIKEYSTGPGSNPQDILPVSQERSYITLYSEKNIKVKNPLSGESLGEIDISSYADSDGVPEAAWMEAAEGKVFVALQRLTNFAPTDKSSLLVLEAQTGKVVKEIALAAPNPFGKIRYNQKLGKLVLSEMGNYGAKDGGIELVNVNDLEAEGLVIDEETLGGDVQDAVVLDEEHGWAVVSVPSGSGASDTRVVAFNPKEGKLISTIHQGSGFSHGLLELSPDGKQLWVTDRDSKSPAIRIFDTTSGQKVTSLDVGLPPFMVCFLE